LAFVVAFLAIIFALQNASAVTVTIGIWRITASLALILLLTLGLGFISGLMVSMPTIIQRNWTIRRYKSQVNQLEAEIQETKQELAHHQQLLAQDREDGSKQQAWVEDQPLREAPSQPLLAETVELDINAPNSEIED
ncbi:MAG: DUF1049 domain-containing protein, partial [Cyanothece sp. SIO2G6]|nr:DUF1049 domain-containing protein [Cyanothece sp. SIO2G6]